MKRALLFVSGFLTSLCLVPVFPAQADPKAPNPAAVSDHDAIAATYQEMADAFSRGDGVGVFRYQAPDMAAVDQNGVTQSRSQQAATQKFLLLLIYTGKNPSASADVQGVDVQGDQATANAKRHLMLMTPAWPGQPSHQVVSDQTVRDFWVKTPIGWQIKREKTLANVTTVDGKPAPALPNAPQP